MRLGKRALQVKPEFHFDLYVGKGDRIVAQWDLQPPLQRNFVFIAPLVNAHFLAHEPVSWRWTISEILASAQKIDRDRRGMAVRDRPNNVLRSKGRIAAEEHFLQCGRVGYFVDNWHARAIEFDADIPLDPRKCVLLTHRDEYCIAFDQHVRFSAWDERSAVLGIKFRAHLLEGDASQAAVAVHERLRHEKIEDRDALMHRVLFFPGRGFHFLKPGADDDGDLLPPEATRRAAAIHRGIAATKNDHALSDARHVPEGDVCKPVDADVDVRGGLFAAGKVEIAPAGGPGADEHGIPRLIEQTFEAVDAPPFPQLDAKIEHVTDLFIYHLLRQAELWNLRPHHSAGERLRVKDGHGIAEGREVTGNRQRGGTGTNTGDPLAVSRCGLGREAMLDLALEIGRNALQPADGDGFILDSSAPAGRFAGPVAGPPENAGKDVGLPVHHIGVAVPAGGDQADVFGHRRMGRAGPLAINNLMKVFRLVYTVRLQNSSKRFFAALLILSIAA